MNFRIIPEQVQNNLLLVVGLMMLSFGNLFSQAKEHEVLSRDSKGDATSFEFKETVLPASDDASMSDFLRKQYDLDKQCTFETIEGVRGVQFVDAERNTRIQRLEQYYRGIRIAFSDMVVVSKNDRVRTMKSKRLNIQKNFNIVPALSEKYLLTRLLKKINAEKYAWEDEFHEKLVKEQTDDPNASFYPKGELMIIDREYFDDVFDPVLVYKFDVYAIRPLSSASYYLDASTGEKIKENSHIRHAKGTAQTRYSNQKIIQTQRYGNSYRLRDTTRGKGVETYNMHGKTTEMVGKATDFTDNDNNWTSAEYDNADKDNAALDAHWAAQKTYDYFKEKHRRNSYDDAGAKIKNYVHYEIKTDNAFWNNFIKAIFYGDGGKKFDALTSLDVVAHEIGHAVSYSTAKLMYEKESGAIDEGLSDIWGAMVEYFVDPTKQTYEMGEDIMLDGSSLRSMSNPHSRNQPNTYKKDPFWVEVTNCIPTNGNDYCGVHTNSGVLNYWFYLLAEGGSGVNGLGNSFHVEGIGKEKAANIVYQAELELTPTSGYADVRRETLIKAKELYKTNSKEHLNTCQAWYAVGVSDDNCSIELSGSQVICNSSSTTYTISNVPLNASVIWTLSSNLIKIFSDNSRIIVKPVSSGTTGSATITANVAEKVTRKTILIGAPQFTLQLTPIGTNYVSVEMNGTSSNIHDQGITSVSWKKTSSGGGCAGYFSGSGYSGGGHGNCNSWRIGIKVTAKNPCGTSTVYQIITPPEPPENDCNTLDFNGISMLVKEGSSCNGFSGLSASKKNNERLIKRVFVYDFSGKLVCERNDLSTLPRGIYIVKVELFNQEILTQKIIK